MSSNCSNCFKISSVHSFKRIITFTSESNDWYNIYSRANDTIDIQINDSAKFTSEELILDISPEFYAANESINDNVLHNKYETKKFSFQGLKSMFSNIRKNRSDSSDLKLELLEDEWSITDGDFSARTDSFDLKTSAKRRGNKTVNSASVNSLDLEWEHLPEMTIFSSNVVEKDPQSATSVGGQSRLSSADSLEWDSAEVEMKEEIDTETEQLIQEIEMLSLKTLQETQEWAS